MAARDNQTMSADIQVEAREIDFVTRFARNWDHLRDIMGIMRPIRKQSGTVLKSKIATVTLQDGDVAEGDVIPLSKAKVTEKDYEQIKIQKYDKSVTMESIDEHGYDVAVAMTDEAFLFELQQKVTDKFYTYLKTGTLTSEETTWQRALAMAKGRVVNAFKKMHRSTTEVVGFVNVLDLYDWLGDKDINIQSEFGFQYIKNFMGYSTVFLLSDDEIEQGKVIATPAENIVLYYIDPSSSDFARAGLVFTTDGETNLIGFHTEGMYSTASSDCYAVMGLTLFAEYLDAIAVISVQGE